MSRFYRNQKLKRFLKAAFVLSLLAVLSDKNCFAFTPGSRAEKLYNEEKYDDALDIYDKALKRKPDDPALGYNRAVVLYRKGDFEEAEEVFVKSAILGGKSLEKSSSYNAGNSKFRIGQALEASNPSGAMSKYTEALDYYKRAMDLDPDDIDAKHNYEFLLKKMEELKSKQQEQQKEEPQQQQDQQDDKKDQEDREKPQPQDEKGDDKEKPDPQDQGEKDSEKPEDKPDPSGQEDKGEEQEEKGQPRQEDKGPESEPGSGKQDPAQPGQSGQQSPSVSGAEGQDQEGMSRQQAEMLLMQQEEEENRVRAQQRKEKEDSRPPVLMDW